MTLNSSTVRTAVDATFAGRETGQAASRLASQIRENWRQSGSPDVVAAIDEHPTLLHERSILIELALEEYQDHCQSAHPTSLSQYCGRFQGLGDSIQNSIFRQLQVQQYIDENPDLLAFVQDTPWPEIGDRIEGYDVLEELGRGSLSRVYLCEEVDLGARQVVVKITKGGDQEAAVLGKLAHPNIVPIHSITSDPISGTSYLCMPFRGRSTLLDLIDTSYRDGSTRMATLIFDAGSLWRKPSDKEAIGTEARAATFGKRDTYVHGVLSMATRLADALEFAHTRGVLHGDLKPSNVLLTPLGEPLLLDFNLALDRERQLNPCGGTLPYMPPERLRSVVESSNGGHLNSTYDIRSEVFSFGTLLYHVLGGRPPFPPHDNLRDFTESANHLLALQREGAPPLRRVNPNVDKRVEAMVTRCLAWAPADRPETMGDVSKALRRELRLAPRVRRRVVARPIPTAVAGAIVSTAVVAAATWYATLAPYHIRQYEKGLAFRESGQLAAAVDCFSIAIDEDPTFRDAIFERARTDLERGEEYRAGIGFRRLTQDFADGKSFADYAYYFQMIGKPGIAVLSYNKALEAGFESCALHNNLGYLLIDQRTNMTRSQQTLAAEEHLQKAFELDSISKTIRFNLIVLDNHKSNFDRSHLPGAAVEHIEFLLDVEPENAVYWETALHIYSSLAKQDSKWVSKAFAALEMVATLGNTGFAKGLTEKRIPKILRGRPEIPAIIRLAHEANKPEPAPAITNFLSVFD